MAAAEDQGLQHLGTEALEALVARRRDHGRILRVEPIAGWGASRARFLDPTGRACGPKKLR
jgi:hypothetical protein